MSSDSSIRSPVMPDEWAAYYALRYQVLRAPWGQPPGSERDGEEASACHLAGFTPDGTLVAVGRLHRVDAASGQIRYMAVAATQRGQGWGSRLLAALEHQAREWALHRLSLNARAEVAAFYERAGYHLLGPGPLLFESIPHVRMEKRLSALLAPTSE